MADSIYPNSARRNCLAETYCEIAMESYYNARSFYQQIKINNYSCDNLYQLSEMEKQVISTVVFSAMCIEAFFNNYAAACLGDTGFYDNFDRLSAISKFQLIAKFILKTDIDKSKSYYSRLKQLIKKRDSYVHNKSSISEFQGFSKDEYEKLKNFEKITDEEYMELTFPKTEVDNTYKEALNALKTIYDIAVFFDSYDTNIYAVIRLFHPSGIVFGEVLERQFKTVVFKDLGIKVDKFI